MPNKAANRADDLAGNTLEATDVSACSEATLTVSGTDLSSDGLDEIAALLLRLGRSTEKRKKRRPKRG